MIPAPQVRVVTKALLQQAVLVTKVQQVTKVGRVIKVHKVGRGWKVRPVVVETKVDKVHKVLKDLRVI